MHTETDSPSIAEARVSKAERQERIVSELQASPAIRASELAASLGVSHETIRRDLMELNEQGLINRTYGGAARPFAFEAPIHERLRFKINERQRIAVEVCKLFRENEVVLIGGGATTNHIARCMAARCRNITVITHDFGVAEALCHNPTIHTLFLAGRIHPGERYVYGQKTLAGIESFQANWAVVGASGIDHHGIYDADDEAAAIYRAMSMRGARAVLVADATKFNQPSLMPFADWGDIDAFVTDEMPDDALEQVIRKAGVKLIVASGA
ncbi:MAG: DeoR/GlpR family DNA-binding transcription regulator [Mesorhizobium sp.]